MKKIVVTIYILIFFFHNHLNAQKFNGEIIYKFRVTENLLQKDSINQITNNSVNEVFDLINKSMVKYQNSFEFKLVFDENKSNYFWDESLEIETDKGIDFVKILTKSDHFYYTNIKDDESLEAFNFYDKNLIIKRNLKDLNWELLDETKKIGNYHCFKAKTVEVNSDKTKIIEAWYTPQITNSFGPKNFAGLPGIILELKEGKITYYASSIKLNYKNDYKIKKPVKGDVISQEQLYLLYKNLDKNRKY